MKLLEHAEDRFYALILVAIGLLLVRWGPMFGHDMQAFGLGVAGLDLVGVGVTLWFWDWRITALGFIAIISITGWLTTAYW